MNKDKLEQTDISRNNTEILPVDDMKPTGINEDNRQINNPGQPSRSTNSITEKQSSVTGGQDLQTIIYNNDRNLLAYAHRYQEMILASTDVNLGIWNCPLFYSDNILLRYQLYEFYNLDPLQQHLEIIRAEAEAWLIHNQLGFCALSNEEKENFMKRALAINLENTDEKFREILSASHIGKGANIKDIYADITAYKKTLQSIKKQYGQFIALAFALLVQNGISKKSEFEHYGRKLDMFLSKIFSLPQIQNVYENRRIENTFNTQYILLATLRDRIMKFLPRRVVDEKKILLTEYLDQDNQSKVAVNTTNDVYASELLFVCLDSLMLAKFGFDTNCVVVDKNILLEIITQERLIYWNPLENTPISYAQPIIKYRSDYLFLVAKTIVKIADIYMQLSRDIMKAIGAYQKAIALIPDFPDTYASLAQVYLKSQDARKAIENLNKAIEINPDAAEFYHMQGLAYCLQNNFAQAITVIKKAISIQPNYIEALNNLGVCYEQTGETVKALETYNQIVNIEPNYFQANFGLGNVYFTLKKYERALIYYERAIKLEPQSTKCLYNLAQTYYELGEGNASIKTYKQLLQINPNHAASWYNLGIIYRNKGMKKEAVKCIEQAVRFNPNLMK